MEKLTMWLFRNYATVEDSGRYYTITYKFDTRRNRETYRIIEQWYHENFSGKFIGTYHHETRKHFIVYIMKEIQQQEATGIRYL